MHKFLSIFGLIFLPLFLFAQQDTIPVKSTGLPYFNDVPDVTPDELEGYTVVFNNNTNTFWYWNYTTKIWEELQSGNGSNGKCDSLIAVQPIDTSYVILQCFSGGSIIDRDTVWFPTNNAIQNQVNNIQTALGIVNGATNFGSFTGSTLSDNETAKVLFQELETAIENVSGGTDYQVADLTALASSSYPLNSLVYVRSENRNYQILDTAPALYNGGSADGLIVVADNNSNFAVAQIKETLQPEFFGAKADFERHQTAGYTDGSNIITCSSCSFTSADVGKVIIVKEARIDAAYSPRRVTLNSTVTGITDANTITIADNVDADGVDKEIFYATNSWMPLQKMFDYANYSDNRNVRLGVGTYYANPTGLTLRTVIGQRGIIQTGDINLTGASKSLSKIKIGVEDRQRVLQADILVTNGILLAGDGVRNFSNFTLESADRQSTETAEFGYSAIYQERTSNIDVDLFLDNVDIVAGGDYLEGWNYAIDSSLGGTWDSNTDIASEYAIYEIKNCYFEAAITGIAFFSQDGASKKLHIYNSKFKGGGFPNSGSIEGVASITSGSNILTVNDPEFSFYDIRSQSSFDDRKPRVLLDNTTSLDVDVILTRNTAQLTSNSPVTYTDVDFYWEAGNDPVEGHGMYIHPNVSLEIDGLTQTHQRNFALKFFSGSGQDGTPEYFRIKNYTPFKIDMSIASIQLIPDNFSNIEFEKGGMEISNSLVKITSGSPKLKIYDSYIEYGTIIGDTTLIENSRGSFRLDGEGKKYTIQGGEYEQIVAGDETSKYIFKDILLGALNIVGGEIFFKGGFLNGIYLPSNTANLISASFSDTEIIQGLGSQTNFLSNTPNDWQDLAAKIKFDNARISGKAVSNIEPIIPLMRIRKSRSKETITSRTSLTQTGANSVNTDYQNLRYLALPYDHNSFEINISNDSISQIEIAENLSIGVYNWWKASTAHFFGDIELNIKGDGFKFSKGGNLRLKHLGKREKGIYKFNKDGNIFIEQVNEDVYSSTIPARDGINKEIVYNSDLSSEVAAWQYNITITDVTAETHSLTGATLPFEFDLTNGVAYLAFEESYYIDPSTLLTITIPLDGGGTEVFTSDNYGHLTGSNGGDGNIRLSDGHIKINSLGAGSFDTSSDLEIDYKYVSSAGWDEILKNSLSVLTDVSSVSSASTTIDLNGGSKYNRYHQIDMTSASTASTITLSTTGSFQTASTHTLHFQNTQGDHDITFPVSFLNMDGTSLGTVTVSSDSQFTCYFDGTNFYCETGL